MILAGGLYVYEDEREACGRMMRVITPLAVIIALAMPVASVATIPPGGLGAGLGDPTAELYDWAYVAENDQTQYFYKVYGNSDSFGVCRFDLYADIAPTLIDAYGIGPGSWTGHWGDDGAGKLHIWWSANGAGDYLWPDYYGLVHYTRLVLITAGNTPPTYNYKWAGFTGQTNWSHRANPTGSDSEGGAILPVPGVVPEPTTISLLLAGCAGILSKRRR